MFLLLKTEPQLPILPDSLSMDAASLNKAGFGVTVALECSRQSKLINTYC